MADTLVIEWDRHRLIAAQGSAGRDSVTITKSAVVNRENLDESPNELGRHLAAVFAAQGIVATEAIVVLPRQLVTVQRVELPNVGNDEIPDMARMQAATRLTVPVESVCLDYTPMPVTVGAATREILLVTVPLKYVNDVRQTLSAAGISLTGVRVSSFGIAASVVHSGLVSRTADLSAIDVIVSLRSDSIDMIYMTGHCVTFTHSGASWTSVDGIEQAVRAEISRSRMSAAEDIGDYTVRRLTLIGVPEITSAVPDSVAKRLNDAEVVRVSPQGKLLTGPIPEGLTASDMVAVVGAISNSQETSVEAVDLINPRKAAPKKDYSRIRNLAIVGTAVLALTGGWKWRTDKVASLNKEAAFLIGDVEDMKDAYKRAKNELELDSRLTEWKNRDISWLDEIRKIRELMGSTERVFIRRFHFSQRKGDYAGAIDAEGYAKTRGDIEDLMRVLRDAGYEVSPTEIKPGLRDPAYPMELSLEVSIPIPKKDTKDSKV